MQTADVGTQQQFPPEEVEVVVIGNGPSGICLSLFFNGYWPYFSGKHVNPALQEKLLEASDTSLVEQDLEYLSDNLEGRSLNPVAVLFDSLNHPNADFGETVPSSLLWRCDQSKAISHVVIGSDEVGGSWNSLQNSKILSLSHKEWLDLPIYGYRQWEEGRVDQEVFTTVSHEGKNKTGTRRTTVSSVCDYYKDYVKELNLESSMVPRAHVTSVQPVPRDGSESDTSPGSPEAKDDDVFGAVCDGFCGLGGSGISWHDLEEQLFFKLETSSKTFDSVSSESLSIETTPSLPTSSPEVKNEMDQSSVRHWSVEGYKTLKDGSTVPFTVNARNVVLACGVTNCPNRLNVPGEDLPFVQHNLNNISALLDDHLEPVKPILVVGAGLSAADVINLALSKEVPVYHVFHRDPRDPKLIFSKLAPSIYPEYQTVYSLMKGEMESKLYRPFPMHAVEAFHPEGLCTIQSKQFLGKLVELRVSLAFVLIGSTADLSFLSDSIPPLGSEPDQGISPKKNPLEVDPFTFESLSQRGLYGLGPLVGDNFVRFTLGGALGVTSKLWKDKKVSTQISVS